ncbi:hypothetical protein [Microcoleus vaginatus]|uniref:hypothetical protein n=1 Tax=Microcoleus vaginatus TaxID=119532 RepID=UPI001F625163
MLTVQNSDPYPAADKNGDYHIVNGNSGIMPFMWEAVDPEGLNVRCEDRTGDIAFLTKVRYNNSSE